MPRAISINAESLDAARASLRRRSWIYPVISLMAAVVMLARAGSTIGVFNDIIDEPYHIAAAVTLLETGRLVQGIETPPISRLVQGFALMAAGVSIPEFAADRTIHSTISAFPIGWHILVNGPVPYWRVLAVARGATLVFAAI